MAMHISKSNVRILLIFLVVGFVALDIKWLHGGKHISNYVKGSPKPRFHFLLPANKANPQLCRTITSALVNGYPAPVLINWGLDVGDDKMNGYDMTTGKNWGVLQYLRRLPREADDELVLMVDAHDTMLQLPFDVAVQRYRAIEVSRPRWLCSGTVMGPAGDLRRLYERAHQMWTSYDTRDGDQHYFGNIYGRQELGRHRLRGSRDWVFPLRERYPDDQIIFPNAETNHTDYHLGVDLGSSLFQSLNAALMDMSPIVHSRAADLEAVDRAHKTHDIYQTPLPFPQDLLDAPPPPLIVPGDDDHYHGGGGASPSEPRSWRDVRLWANFRARVIPAVMHFNGVAKLDWKEWWHKQWWTGRGRELLRRRTGEPGFALETDAAANTRMTWDELCAPFESDMFDSN
ncbi:hypothetical protein AAL_04686 [Moelleriella libera RCEF 2490]|uniref:Uncharacterized protein n=1 Tax=Moelleriella libera RCEF 2490 TaxID=1081109 RepID=A0A168BLG3_9HYPO|nr:hypothetical protein AAL_04686 [Moelleriella libera RCEF 2490]